MEATLLTGRTWKQGAGMEIGRDSEEYAKAIAICEIGREDMKKIGVHLTDTTGMPQFKGIKVKVEPAPGEKPLTIKELIREVFS